MKKPTVYADFNNADAAGRLRLNCAGSSEDLARLDLRLEEGLPLLLHDEELEADGEAHFSATERIWVASIDWGKVRQRTA